MNSVEGCLACDLLGGRREAPGGTLAETDLWAVQHCVGPLGLGTLILWSHAGNVPGHIHWVVQPAEPSDDDCRRGPALQAAMFEAGELPDPAAVEAVSGRLRAALAEEAV